HDLLSSMENPLVVLDSWEGISDYIPSEARMKVEQSLMAVLEETGARLILVSEHSEANTTLDQLADAILILRQKVIDDRRLPALLNFLATNNAVMMFPYSDFDPKRSRLFATQFLAEDMYDANMRVFTTDRVEDPVAIKFSLDMAKDFEMWLEVYGKFKNQGKIIWKLMALDTVENFYGQGVMDFLATVAARVAV